MSYIIFMANGSCCCQIKHSRVQQLWCSVYSIHYLRTQLLQDQVQPNITSTSVLKTGVCPLITWLACFCIYSSRHLAAFSLPNQYTCWMTMLNMFIYSNYCASICARCTVCLVFFFLILLHYSIVFGQPSLNTHLPYFSMKWTAFAWFEGDGSIISIISQMKEQPCNKSTFFTIFWLQFLFRLEG